MDNHFWRGKKVLVTGHTGFKGGWLSLWLQSLGAELVGVSLDPPTTPNLYSQAKVGAKMISIREDVRNLSEIMEIFLEHKPEIVFHMAAQPLVRYSYEQPVETYQTNVMGTLHVLEAIKECKSVISGVIVTTDKCYENRGWEWGYREIDLMGGYDPYSSSKTCAELLVSSYRDSFFSCFEGQGSKASIATVRAGNVVGGGDWAKDRLIPDILKAFKNNEPVQIRNPNAVRPWQHVLDPLYGYIVLAEKLYLEGSVWAEAWNFGPNDEGARTVKYIVERMSDLWAGNVTWSVDDMAHPHEMSYLKLDCSKAHSRLKWMPKWDLEETLRQVVDWHNEVEAGESPESVCQSQILKYTNSFG